MATCLQSLVILPQIAFSGVLLAIAAMGDAGRASSGAVVLRRIVESLGHAVALNALFGASNSATGQALLGQSGDAFAHDQTRHWAIIAASMVVPLLLIGLILPHQSADSCVFQNSLSATIRSERYERVVHSATARSDTAKRHKSDRAIGAYLGYGRATGPRTTRP